MNYYGVNEKYEAIKAKLYEEAEQNDGEVSEALAEAMDRAEIDREDAIFGIMYDIKNSGAELDKVNAVIADLADKKKTIEARIDSRKKLLATIAGRESYSDGVVSTTKAVSASLVITGEVPDKYIITEEVVKTVEKVDKKAIKSDIEDSCEWAHLEYRKSVK